MKKVHKSPILCSVHSIYTEYEQLAARIVDWKKQKRWVYLAYLKKNANQGPCMYIAADTYRQAFGFAVQHNAQGYMKQIVGAVTFTEVTPIELRLEVPRA